MRLGGGMKNTDLNAQYFYLYTLNQIIIFFFKKQCIFSFQRVKFVIHVINLWGKMNYIRGQRGGGDISKTPGLFLIYFRLSNGENFYFSHFKPSPLDPAVVIGSNPKHHENDHLPKLNIYKYESIFCSLTIPDFSFFVSLINRFSSSQTNSIQRIFARNKPNL